MQRNADDWPSPQKARKNAECGAEWLTAGCYAPAWWKRNTLCWNGPAHQPGRALGRSRRDRVIRLVGCIAMSPSSRRPIAGGEGCYLAPLISEFPEQARDILVLCLLGLPLALGGLGQALLWRMQVHGPVYFKGTAPRRAGGGMLISMNAAPVFRFRLAQQRSTCAL